MECPYTLRDIQSATGKTNQSLYTFIKENKEFINEHSHKNGRFIKYDEVAYQEFIKRFGKVDKEEPKEEATEVAQEAQNAPSAVPEEEPTNTPPEVPQSVIEAFEAQIKALQAERDELAHRLSSREEDIKLWREQAGQALSALSKEQDRVEKLEERLAGYLPSPTTQEQVQQLQKRKLTFRERLTGHITTTK